MAFAALVLLILAGIIASLVVGAWPALERFGPGFITRIEWDPVNDEYGALIAIAGTVVTSFIALLIDRKSTRLNSSHEWISRMPSSA